MTVPRYILAVTFGLALGLPALPTRALDVLELADLPAAEQQRMVDAFLEVEAAAAPPEDLVQFFDSEMVELRFDQLDSIYQQLAPRMPRTAFPLLTREALGNVSYMAAPALRLIGLSAGDDAFQVLSRRIADHDEEIACGALAGMGFLGDARGVPLLEKQLARADEETPFGRRHAEVALALAHLGRFEHLQRWFGYLGDVDAARLTHAHTGTRVHYTPAQDREAALKEVQRLERLLAYMGSSFRRLWRNNPADVSSAVAACTYPPALELLYDAMVDVMTPDRAASMMPLLDSRSVELRGAFLDLALPHLEARGREAALKRITDSAADRTDSRSRVFAALRCHLLDPAPRDALLEALLADPSPWVRSEAARTVGQARVAKFGATLQRMADDDPDSLVRVAAQAALPYLSRH